MSESGGHRLLAGEATGSLVYLRSASEEQQYEAVTKAIISRLTDSLTYSALDFGYWLWYWVSSGLHRTTWVTDGLLTYYTGEPGENSCE